MWQNNLSQLKCLELVVLGLTCRKSFELAPTLKFGACVQKKFFIAELDTEKENLLGKCSIHED